MNFGRRGIRSRQEYLNTRSRKRINKILIGAGQLLLVGVIGLGVAGVSMGLGVFRGVIDSAPSQTIIDVSPKGFSSFVYDAKEKQIAKLVSADSNRIPVSGDMITDDLAHAFVAIEDEIPVTYAPILIPLHGESVSEYVFLEVIFLPVLGISCRNNTWRSNLKRQ